MTGESLGRPEGLPLDEADWAASALEPRRYGFHGTLKAPFELPPDRDEDGLLKRLREVARKRTAFEVARLEVAALGPFLALVPAEPAPDLDRLAGDCVRAFDAFRAPLSEADRQRRLAAPLSARQVAALERWGYPYVFEDFRFHMTLTGPLPEARREPVRAALAGLYAAVAARPALAVGSLAIFRQPARTERFRVLAEMPFAG